MSLTAVKVAVLAIHAAQAFAPSSSSSSLARGSVRVKSEPRVELPSPETFRDLSMDTFSELSVAGGPSILLRRALSAQMALGETLLRAVVVPGPRDISGQRRAARSVRELFERLGATYVKMGQLIASSPSVFSPEIIAEFEQCLDDAPPLPFEEIRRTVESAMGGRRLEEMYSEFDVEPLACASVAQVHGARLSDGRRVVVKVRKPGVEQTLTVDLAGVSVAAKWIQAVAPETRRVDPVGLVSELRDSVIGELDFNLEAERLRQFQIFLEENGIDDKVVVPVPIPELSSETVLTMTRIDGKPLVDAPIKTKATEEAVATLVRTWALSVVNGPFFHADMHAGNVLLLRDGKKIGLLDFGVVGYLPSSTYDAVLTMADAYKVKDSMAVAVALRDMGVAKETLSLDTLAQDLERTIFADNTTSDSPSSAETLVDLIDVSRRNSLLLPREFSLLVKQALYLDRYISALAPGMDVFSDPRVGLTQQPDLTHEAPPAM